MMEVSERILSQVGIGAEPPADEEDLDDPSLDEPITLED